MAATFGKEERRRLVARVIHRGRVDEMTKTCQGRRGRKEHKSRMSVCYEARLDSHCGVGSQIPFPGACILQRKKKREHICFCYMYEEVLDSECEAVQTQGWF